MDAPLQKITDEQLDFIRELVNIGAGNAATALEQVLQCKVDLLMPKVRILSAHEVAPYLTGSPATPVIGVRMDLVGDITGALYVILSRDDLEKFSSLIKNVTRKDMNDQENYTVSAIAEISNVLARVYLTAVHDFCSLTIFHTIPRTAVDMIQSILDETLIEIGGANPDLFIFINEFTFKPQLFKMYMILIPSPGSYDRLAGSLQAARGGLGNS